VRPAIVEFLDRVFGTELFRYLVPNYLMMLCLGMFVGTIISVLRARKRNLDPDPLLGLILWAFPAALLGGRLLHFILEPEAYSGGVASFFDPLQGGGVAYGGLLAGTLAGLIYLLRRGQGVWNYLDCAAPGLGIAVALTRLGCFLDGCDYGLVSEVPWALRFPAGSPAHGFHVVQGLVALEAPCSLPVHPTQLYLAAKGLLLAGGAWAWGRWMRPRPGEEFLVLWILYAVLRFAVEFLRGDPERGFVGPLSTSQAISIPVFLAAAALFWRRRTLQTGDS